MIPEKYRKYLPSSHFVKIVALCFAVLALVIGTTKLSGFVQKKKLAAKEQKLAEEYANGILVAISDLAEKDSDGDGIADWEEALWGTDPNNTDTDTDGESDKTEIEKKKQSMSASVSDQMTTGELSETEAFSRELFASIAALKESGNLNSKSIEDLAATISQNAGEKGDIAPAYTADAMQKRGNSPADIQSYHDALLKTFRKYDDSGIGTELEIIDTSLSVQDEDKISELHALSLAYKNLAADLIKTSAPDSATAVHLALANGAQALATALENVTHIYDNPIRGLIGISQYQNESNLFDEELTKLQEYFRINGILK